MMMLYVKLLPSPPKTRKKYMYKSYKYNPSSDVLRPALYLVRSWLK